MGKKSGGWLRRLSKIALVGAVVSVAGAEGVARFYLGLGDPPLMVADPDLEYAYKPSSTYSRFGNRVSFNAYSMRSEELSKTRESPDEVRVLMIGDSVLEAGAYIDQSQIASELLKRDLAVALKRKVVLGNASAKSWGPPNMLAYVKRHGFFDANLVILLISSHDAFDVPTFVPVVGVHPSFPAEKPLLALEEAVVRYLPKYLPMPSFREQPLPAPASPEDNARLKGVALGALRELIEMARSTGAKVLVAQHLEQSELSAAESEGHQGIRETALAAGAEVVQVGQEMKKEKDAGQEPYVDSIHVNAGGQGAIARVLLPEALRLIEAKP